MKPTTSTTPWQANVCNGCHVYNCPHRSNYTSDCAIRSSTPISFENQTRRYNQLEA